MKNIVKLILLLFVITIPINVKGYCTTDEKIRYSTLASNITTSYEYIESDDEVLFNITIHNVHKDLIILDKQTGKKYSSNKEFLNNFDVNNLASGKSYVFEVYANDNDCLNRLYNTLYVTIPKYNKYYKDPVCQEASDYLYCQKWVELGDISYTEFLKLVGEYKDKEINEEVNKNSDEETNWIYILGDFWAKYYAYILSVIIVICLTIIIIKNKRDNFDF
ncbi:MAG: hypothetical protein E7165_02210 [Firmicutes bacterium]|nr:hypothetical protein [Bacillota bacterium]